MLQRLRNEPARVIAVFVALLGVAVTFGVHLSDPQLESIKNVLALLLPLLGGEAVRSQVTPTGPKPPSVPPVALGVLAFLLVACTPAEQQIVNGVTEAVCVAVVSVEAPAAEPLCVYADELAAAIETYIASHGGTAPMVASSASGKTVVAGDLYRDVAARPGIKARRGVTVCKPAQGGVSP